MGASLCRAKRSQGKPLSINLRLEQELRCVTARTTEDLVAAAVQEYQIPTEYEQAIELWFSNERLRPKISLEVAGLVEGGEVIVRGVVETRAAHEADVHEAALNADLTTINLVINFAPERLNEQDKGKRTVLHLAALQGNVHMVQALLQAPELAIEAKDTLGFTALYLSWMNKHSEITEMLEIAGSTPLSPRQKMNQYENGQPLEDDRNWFRGSGPP
eukprot:TRINITY_DN2639_c0_g1_i1.p1 TRINITY_DN2639_c0_g1~~TRINITY_DN2639_c0_g1_i1.p1  ORF type:complete len:217 (+),score=34.46 TRINITY_DN2639_c0_g1_i1:134-784(+)